jgi:hypothetical protein
VSLPFVAYSNVELYALREYTSYYHNILPQPAQQSMFYEPSSDRAVSAERDLGGFNNIRMGAEVHLSIALKYKRRFAIPQRTHFYLVDAPAISIFDYYDEEHFRKVVPSIEYYGGDRANTYTVPVKYTMSDNTNFIGFDELPDEQDWYFPFSNNGGTRIFSQYTEDKIFKPNDPYISLVHRAFRVRKEIVDTAIKALVDHNLTPQGFNAMHVRRNDFQYNDVRHVSHEAILAHVGPFIKDEPLLIISDEYNEDLIKLMGTVASRVVMWKCGAVYPGIKCPPTMLMVDMLAAVPAKRFFGSPLSTFSANIVQWRNRVHPDTRMQYTMPYTQQMQHLPYWARPGELGFKVTDSKWRDLGYEKLRMHPEVSRLLLDFDQEDRFRTQRTQSSGNSVEFKRLPTEWKAQVNMALQPLVEQWAGFKVVWTGSDLGPMKFQAGASYPVKPESDDKKVIGVMLVISGDSTQPRVQVRARTGKMHRIAIKADEMMFFAGLGCEHGRPDPGGAFGQFYSYYRPASPADCATDDCNYCGATC